MPLTELHLRAARAQFASRVPAIGLPLSLGDIVLRPSQRRSLDRVRAAIARHGGCLLADDVGRGKTYIALALAREYRAPLIVAPASLRATWEMAMRRTEVSCAFVSHEALSRPGRVRHASDLIVVDESHHFRSPATRRHAALAAVACTASILLMSATPLQNRLRDLSAQVALFLGDCAFTLPAEALAYHVVRNPLPDDDMFPALMRPCWLSTATDDTPSLRAILALPPPPRALDAGDAGALRMLSLVRAWASSRAALVATVHRRRRNAIAMEQSLGVGRRPSRADLLSWHAGEDGVQLGFVPLLVAGQASCESLSVLRDAVTTELRGLERLDNVLRTTPDPDDARADAVAGLRARHAGMRILVFSEFASTVRSCFRRLVHLGGVAMLTANESRIASGRIPRVEVLRRFAPVAQGAAEPHERERVTLLLATDLLSEGLNLQDAAVVVHLDLPWNPARLAQRVGRVRRPGGAERVFSFLLAPPARADVLLSTEARLRRKVRRAEQVIGGTLDVMPCLASAAASALTPSVSAAPRQMGEAESGGAVDALRAEWGAHASAERRWRGAIVAGVAASRRGWIAVLGNGRVLGTVRGRPVLGGPRLHALLREAQGEARPISSRQESASICAVRRLLAREQVALQCGLAPPRSLTWESLDDAVTATIRRVPRHERMIALGVARDLREQVAGGLPLGLEREVASRLLALRHASPAEAMALLRDALDLTRLVSSRSVAHKDQSPEPPVIRAVIVLVPYRDRDATRPPRCRMNGGFA